MPYPKTSRSLERKEFTHEDNLATDLSVERSDCTNRASSAYQSTGPGEATSAIESLHPRPTLGSMRKPAERTPLPRLLSASALSLREHVRRRMPAVFSSL